MAGRTFNLLPLPGNRDLAYRHIGGLNGGSWGSRTPLEVILSHFGPFLAILGLFWPFWGILAIWASFEPI